MISSVDGKIGKVRLEAEELGIRQLFVASVAEEANDRYAMTVVDVLMMRY